MLGIIPEKETLTIEFKSDKKNYSDDDLVDEVVGMANTLSRVWLHGVAVVPDTD